MQRARLVNQLELLKLDMRKQYALDDQEVELLLSNPGQAGEAQAADGTALPAGAMGGVSGAPLGAGAPMTMAQALAPGGAAPSAPGAPQGPGQPQRTTMLEQVDLVKLYQAAASSGDSNLMDQIVERLGFTPSDELPTGIAAQAAQVGNTKIQAALAAQKMQHDMEQAAHSNTTDKINAALAVGKHQMAQEQALAPQQVSNVSQ